jgi:hypothetical protein
VIHDCTGDIWSKFSSRFGTLPNDASVLLESGIEAETDSAESDESVGEPFLEFCIVL